MAKIDIKRTELVWKGKYDNEGKFIPVDRPGPYPFQIVEAVNTLRIGHDNVWRLQSLVMSLKLTIRL